jgi:hypothetical protein
MIPGGMENSPKMMGSQGLLSPSFIQLVESENHARRKPSTTDMKTTPVKVAMPAADP